MSGLYQFNGVRVIECPAETQLRSGRDALDLISLAREHEADLVAVPVERAGEEFFRLSTGVAGEIVQKFETYGVRLAMVGDISRHLEQSPALRSFVLEANRGERVWFVANKRELEERLNNRSA
jgi:hypothetical protein